MGDDEGGSPYLMRLSGHQPEAQRTAATDVRSRRSSRYWEQDSAIDALIEGVMDEDMNREDNTPANSKASRRGRSATATSKRITEMSSSSPQRRTSSRVAKALEDCLTVEEPTSVRKGRVGNSSGRMTSRRSSIALSSDAALDNGPPETALRITTSVPPKKATTSMIQQQLTPLEEKPFKDIFPDLDPSQPLRVVRMVPGKGIVSSWREGLKKSGEAASVPSNNSDA
ncbi:hypothetical protein HDU76_009157, partial [Blyttiomyces sp. JEL0837]